MTSIGKMLLFAALLASCFAHAEPKRIKKWVDEKGVTHYGDTIPPQYAGKNSEISSQGIAVKPKPPVEPKTGKQPGKTPEMTEEERRDKALLNSFTTAQEIDLARDRNLQMDQAAVQGLKQRLTEAEGRLKLTNSGVADLNKQKKPIPADLVQTQKDQQGEIEKIKGQIAQKQASMDATRTRFENDKKRFIELKSPTPAPVDSTSTPTPPVATPAN
jgi:hypothetical protein